MDKKQFTQLVHRDSHPKEGFLFAVSLIDKQMDTLGNVWPLSGAETHKAQELVALKLWALDNANRIMWDQDDED